MELVWCLQQIGSKRQGASWLAVLLARWIGFVRDCLTCSCFQRTQQRAYCVFTYFEDGSLFVTLDIRVFKCKVMTFTF